MTVLAEHEIIPATALKDGRRPPSVLIGKVIGGLLRDLEIAAVAVGEEPVWSTTTIQVAAREDGLRVVARVHT